MVHKLVNGSSVNAFHRKPSKLGGKSTLEINKTYLPSDIPSLKKKLQILVGEYIAGNTTTRSQILAILDNLKGRREIAAMEYALIKDLTQPNKKFTQDATDVDSLVEDDAGDSSTENTILDVDKRIENSTVNVDDVSEYLIPVNGYQNGVCDMNYMIKVTSKDIIHSKCERVVELVEELKNQLVHERNIKKM